MNKKDQAKKVLEILKKNYTHNDDQYVHWSNPLELVIGTVLSAQCTDKRVNMVTAVLFKKYKTAQDYADANPSELEVDIKSTGFYKSKSKYLKGIGQLLVEKYDGKVPQTVDELLELPGVAKKTASLVTAKAFGKLEGVAVDTHVKRLAKRLGLTDATNPDTISTELEKIVEQNDWLNINEYLILHGRAVCKARRPRCDECPLKDVCPSAGIV